VTRTEPTPISRAGVWLWLTLGLFLVSPSFGPAYAVPRITLEGPSTAGPVAPDAEGRFSFPDVPLRRNALNVFTVTATDDAGKTISRDVRITQLSLDSIVVSKVTATPLTVQQVQQLVSDGTIKLDDPENFNVSQFDIVLTIAKQPIPISIPIAMPKVSTDTGFETLKLPVDTGPSSGGTPRPEPVDIIVFAQPVPPSPDLPRPPPIPGVIIIEGSIKTLKEFFSVRLLLMNASGIFTLKDVVAKISFPTGGLSNSLPADGLASFGDILPGAPDQPGQAEREFIIRGDQIGVRPVQVDFGGTVGGPGIPDDSRIPFNGSATASVEVKGPPTFQVQVKHPPTVVAGVPYDLTIDITNTGQTPALYASLRLDVGADGKLVDCTVDDATGLPVCAPIEGPSTRSLGNILPGQRVSETFTVDPLSSGTISSCLGVADQNISLQVLVGAINCLVGTFPPTTVAPDGVPTVTVLPGANTLGVGIDSPVTAFFSKQMNVGTITTGPTGSFRVIDDASRDVSGQLRFETVNDKTVAIWQVDDGITNRLAENSQFTVRLGQDIRDLQGNALASAWVSRFTTTSAMDDHDPPSLTLSVEPPVNPNRVLSGQIVKINAYAADQGSGVARVELRRQDTNVAGAQFELVDQKTVFDTSSGPCIFSVDSAKLVAGHTYQFKATAYDKAGNSQDATIAMILSPTSTSPIIQLADPGQPILQGIALVLRPVLLSATVQTVNYFVDGAAVAARTVTLPPFQATLDTLPLTPGPHEVRAVAVDGLGQTGQATLAFTVAANGGRPAVDFGPAVNGAQYAVGTGFLVIANATDPVGIQSVQFFLDAVNGAAIASGLAPFTLSTAGLSLGPHRLIIVAANKLGVSNDVNAAASSLVFSVVAPGNGSPPAAPALDSLSAPQNGVVTVAGTTEAGARLDITNVTKGLSVSVFADGTGRFSGVIATDPGDQIRVVAVNLVRSTDPSAAATVTVPSAPALDHIAVTPSSLTFTSGNEFRDLTVTAFFTNSSTATVTGQASYSSSNTAVASVNGAGRVVALSSGSATITAQFGGKQAQSSVGVNIRTLTSIALDPPSFTIAGIGRTRQLAVTGTYSDNTTAPITSGITFATDAPAVALVNASGLVTSTGLGRATISAAVTGLLPAQSQGTVAAVGPVSISVSPSSIQLTAAGETRQLQVSRTLSDGTIEPAPPPITYESADTGVATVNAVGLVTAVADGDTTLTVTHQGLQATVAVSVAIPVVVTPPVIDTLDRPRAAEGDPFTIRGTHFAALPGQNQVRVNGVLATVQSARQDELTAVVPVGATSGPVTVTVGSFTSNPVTLAIYPRHAVSLQITVPVDVPATSGQTLTLTLTGLQFRAGDVALLSSAPDTPAPLSFTGSMTAKVDSGTAVNVPASSTHVIDVTSLFSPGTHTLTLKLTESGGRVKTDSIFLFIGPDNTGPIAGERSVVALAQNRPIPVTVTELPYPDGAKVAVTAQEIGVSNPDGSCCVSSAGGSIVNAEGVSPNDGRFVFFTVHSGRVDLLYDPASAGGFQTGSGGIANLQVLPADPSGSRIGFQAVVVEPVTLTTYDTASAARTQSAVIADGRPKVVTIRLDGMRDTAGNLVPNGSTVAVTALEIGVSNPDGSCCVNSVGGSIVNGVGTSPNDGRFVFFTVQSGHIDIQYDPGNVLLAVGDVRTANVQVLPAAPNGSRIGFRAFTVIPVTLSSPSAQPANIRVVPSSTLADGGDNRVTITVAGLTDTVGNPVPDGTMVAATTLEIGVSNPDGSCCVDSAGGNLVNALGNSPNDGRFGFFAVQGGQVQIVYSTAAAARLETRQSATARVALLPAQPDGSRIGFRAFAVADITLTGYQTADATATPTSAVADGLSKIVTVTLTGVRDTAGNLVPDGAKIAVTTQEIGVVNPDGSCCVNSPGGTIVNGAGSSPNDGRFAFFTVQSGRVDIQYDPAPVQLAVGDVRTARASVLPATPDGSRIGFRAFVVVPVTLSSVTAQPVNVSTSPTSVLADGADNRVTVTVGGITDVLGHTVPNGTRLAVTPLEIGVTNPDGSCCVNSAGGSIVDGLGGSPNDGRFVFVSVNNGQTHVTYSTSGAVALEARGSATARVSVLPAGPDGGRIGFRAFAVATITLAGYQDADISGPGTVAPGATATYTVSNIRDTSGNLVPNGSRIAVTAFEIGVNNPDGSCCVNSAGGSIVNGQGSSPNDGRFAYFTVQNGQISIQLQAPSGTGTSVLQLLPANPDGNRISFRAFAVKSIAVGP
jgi:hypothetical protein